jgi:hypothetical protein
MNKTAWIAVLLATATVVPAAERRRGRELHEGTPVTAESAASEKARTGIRAAASAGQVRQAGTGAPQSPVLLQLFRQGTMSAGYAQAVEDLPAGTMLTLFFITPDGRQTRNTTYKYDDGIQAGDWFKLPDIREFGPLWTNGIHVWDLWVEKPDGSTSHCLADFTVRYYRSASEIAQVVPLIKSTRIERADGRVTLVATGTFLDEKPLALMEDWVVPSAAISSHDQSEVRIELTAIPDFPANEFDSYLLTLAQGGASDTFPVRVIP